MIEQAESSNKDDEILLRMNWDILVEPDLQADNHIAE